MMAWLRFIAFVFFLKPYLIFGLSKEIETVLHEEPEREGRQFGMPYSIPFYPQMPYQFNMGSVAANIQCPFPYKQVGSSCLYGSCVGDVMPWNQARYVCNKMNGDLAVLKKDCDYDDIKNYLSVIDGSSSCDLWVGAEESSPNSWQWIDGTQISKQDSIWRSYPSSASGRSSRKGFLKVANTLKMFDALKERTFLPLCEFKIPQASSFLPSNILETQKSFLQPLQRNPIQKERIPSYRPSIVSSDTESIQPRRNEEEIRKEFTAQFDQQEDNESEVKKEEKTALKSSSDHQFNQLHVTLQRILAPYVKKPEPNKLQPNVLLKQFLNRQAISKNEDSLQAKKLPSLRTVLSAKKTETNEEKRLRTLLGQIEELISPETPNDRKISRRRLQNTEGASEIENRSVLDKHDVIKQEIPKKAARNQELSETEKEKRDTIDEVIPYVVAHLTSRLEALKSK